MKFGIDFHGVADTKKKFFSEFTRRVVDNGGEVHIITGNMKTEEIFATLFEYGIVYTHFFSVSDKLLEEDKATHWTSPDDPWFEAEEWNGAKANYCKENQIDLMIDDSEEYGKYFVTPYLKVV